MKISTRDISLESLDALGEMEALCLFVGRDERPLRGTAGFADWRMCGKLSRVLLQGLFQGDPSENLLLPSEGRLAIPRIFAFGSGAGPEEEPRLSEMLAHAGRTLSRAGIRSVATELPGAGRFSDEDRVRLWIHAFGSTFRGDWVVALCDRTVAKLLPEQLPSVAA